MNKSTDKERLLNLLAEENDRTIQNALNGCDSDFVPSKRFTKRMERMIKNAQSGRALDYKPPTRKYVMLAIIALVLTAVIVLASSTNALSHVRSALRSELSEIFGIKTETTDQQSIDTEYVPSFVPMGFSAAETTVLPTIIRYAWVNSNGDSLVFIQQLESEKNIFEEDNLIFGEMKTKNATVTVAHNDTIVHYVWNAHGYSFKISAYPTLSSTLVARMIESISEKN